MRQFVKNAIQACGYNIHRIRKESADRKESANPAKLEKAWTFLERYREIVSDPLNILINRVPNAGYVDDKDCVILHNGHRVPVTGALAYYSDFSDILIINRGVHEPLEEYCFQTVLKKIKGETPRMVELGAYWAHYSMWLIKNFPKAVCTMVEPDPQNLKCGKNNFEINGYTGEFINAFVGANGFKLDEFAKERAITDLDILHSDIQGYELEMLDGARSFLFEHRVKYVFISTHSEALHEAAVQRLKDAGYRVETSSGFDLHTTSCDGFVLATAPDVAPVFGEFHPLGRLDIARATPEQLIQALSSYPL